MYIIFSLVGIVLVFVTKLFVNNQSDEPVDKWRRVFEIPADITFLAFLMGVAGTTTLTSVSIQSEIALIGLIIVNIVSVALFKHNCLTVSNNGGIVQFNTAGKAIALFLTNLTLSIIAFLVSLLFFGANAK